MKFRIFQYPEPLWDSLFSTAPSFMQAGNLHRKTGGEYCIQIAGRMEKHRRPYIVKNIKVKSMCKNVFKNQEEKKRKEDFTRLFARLISDSVKAGPILERQKQRE